MEKTKVSVVIPVYNQLRMTIDCVNDVLKTAVHDLEIIVVDDGSREPIQRSIQKLFPEIKCLKNDVNKGFARTINLGIMSATSEYICLLNNDIRINNPYWLDLMMDSLKECDLTAPAGGRMDKDYNYVPGEVKNNKDKFNYLAFWCALIKKDVFEKIGLIPEQMGTGFFEDVYFCYKAEKAGFKMSITEGTKVEHKYHATFKAEGYDISKEYREKRKIFLELIKKEK